MVGQIPHNGDYSFNYPPPYQGISEHNDCGLQEGDEITSYVDSVQMIEDYAYKLE